MRETTEDIWSAGTRRGLSVPDLPAANPRDRPEAGEQAGAVAVHGDGAPVEPLEPPVAARDDRPPFSIEDDAVEWVPGRVRSPSGGESSAL